MNVYLLLVDCVFKLSKKREREKHLKGFVIYALNLVCYLYKCVHLFGSEFSEKVDDQNQDQLKKTKQKKDQKEILFPLLKLNYKTFKNFACFYALGEKSNFSLWIEVYLCFL